METTMSARLLRIAREALAKRAGAAEQEGAEDGFTLIELMVVLLIMAILLAIAIPTFLGVKGGAQDRAAQSNLSNALISAKSIYATQGSYPAYAALQGTLATQEPELTFTNVAASKGTNQISMAVSAGNQQLVLVGYSASGICWAVSDNDGETTANDLGAAPNGTSYTAWNPSLPSGVACNAGVTQLGAATALTGLAWSTTGYPTATPLASP